MVNLEVVNNPVVLEIIGEPPVLLEVVSQSIELEMVALQGLAGREGVDGLLSAFEFTQSTPSAIWTINHNRNTEPTFISVQDVVGNGLDGFGIEHNGLNQTRLLFNPAAAGKARIL